MNSLERSFGEAFPDCPLVAILRGILPEESIAVGEALVDAGFRLLEVPLNSPNAFESIRLLAKAFRGKALVGAGTVLSLDEVREVKYEGGTLIVSPDCKPGVIRASKSAGLISIPGYFTVTEAFAAISCGADALKLFPAAGATPAMLKAQRAVLPSEIPILPVGGVSPDVLGDWIKAGASGFGLGSNLYKAGKSVEDVRRDAQKYIQALEGQKT